MQEEEIRSRILRLEEAIQRILEVLERLKESDGIILELLKRQD